MASPANTNTNLLNPIANPPAIVDTHVFRDRSYIDDRTYLYQTPGVYESNYYNIFETSQTVLPHTKTFVKWVRKFNKEYNENRNKLANLQETEVTRRFSFGVANFLTLNPEAFSIEISEDQTLFYTFKKKDFSFYIDQYLDLEENSNEEFVLTSFEKNQMKEVRYGNISTILQNIEDTLR